PKTLSALLEAMAESQVTVDGVTRRLPDPFLVLATENPIEHEGTFPLPEAQLDRFFIQVTLGYPSADEELGVVLDQRRGHPLGRLGQVISLAEVRAVQRSVGEVVVDRVLPAWVGALVRAARVVEMVGLAAPV